MKMTKKKKNEKNISSPFPNQNLDASIHAPYYNNNSMQLANYGNHPQSQLLYSPSPMNFPPIPFPPHLGRLPMISLVHRVISLNPRRIEITHHLQLTHKRKLPRALNLARKDLSHLISRWPNTHLASPPSTWTSHHTQSTNQPARTL